MRWWCTDDMLMMHWWVIEMGSGGPLSVREEQKKKKKDWNRGTMRFGFQIVWISKREQIPLKVTNKDTISCNLCSHLPAGVLFSMVSPPQQIPIRNLKYLYLYLYLYLFVSFYLYLYCYLIESVLYMVLFKRAFPSSSQWWSHHKPPTDTFSPLLAFRKYLFHPFQCFPTVFLRVFLGGISFNTFPPFTVFSFGFPLCFVWGIR